MPNSDNARQALVQEQVSHVLRNLQILNGGGAVTLLAFLGQTWTEAPQLRSAILVSIAIHVLGILAAVVASFSRAFRVKFLVEHVRLPLDGLMFWIFFRGGLVLSFLLFCASIIHLLIRLWDRV